MIAVQIIGSKAYIVEYKQRIFGRKSVFIIHNSLEEIKGKKAVLIPAAEDALFIQFEHSGLEPGRDKKIIDYLKKIGREEKEVEIFSTSNLAVVLLKEKINILLQKLKSANIKPAGIIPEGLAVYRLLKDKLEENKEFLILNLGKQNSRVYFINKKGPSKIKVDPVQTEKLIPVVQKLLKNSKNCKEGFLFGEKSMAFSKELFEKETGIALSEVNYGPSVEYIPVSAGSALFKEKEYLKYMDEKRKIKLSFPPKLRYLLLALGAAFITGGIAVLGFRYLNLNSTDKNFDKQNTISQTPTEKPSATPTLMPEVKPEDVRVRILNGSGVRGAAAVLADKLSKEGFDIVEKGNADRFDYKETKIRFKKGEEDKKDLLLKSLSDQKTATSESNLGEDDKADVEIILGKE